MIRRNALFSALLTTGLLGLAGTASASQILVLNKDTANVGLNSTVPAAPVGGNQGTTRGEQARIVFEFAANMWGAVLQGTVPVKIDAKFGPLTCTDTSAVLGSTGVVSYQSWDASNAPAGTLTNMWYPAALANQLTGADATPSASHISMSFNGSLGTAGCMPNSGWYFGLDGNTPVGQSNLLNVMLHEMGHGLGFSGRTNLTSGAMPSNRDDIYSHFAYSNTYNKAWFDLTNAQRVIAAKDDGNMVLRAPNVVAQAPMFLGHPQVLHISAPTNVAGDYKFGAVSPPAAATMGQFDGPIVAAVTNPVVPSTDGTSTQGCLPFTNAADVSGKIALIDRGTCSFDIKVGNARDAGAVGVILANNAAGFVAPAITVALPVIVLSNVDGARLRTGLNGLAGGLAYGAGLAGADAAGNVLMYVPTVLAQGSTFSHYDISLTPNALMEPFESPDLVGHIDLDLTPAMFKDEGWQLNETGQMLLTCNTGIKTWIPSGIVIGANVYASAKNIAASAPNVGVYRTAVHNYAADLAQKQLITSAEATGLNACLSDAETLKQFRAWSPYAPVALQNGLMVTDQSGKAGTSKSYELDVPNGALGLILRTAGGTGDVSIYVKVGETAGPANYTYKSVHAGSNTESVQIARPVAGTYSVTVFGETDYSGVTVLGSFTDTAR